MVSCSSISLGNTLENVIKNVSNLLWSSFRTFLDLVIFLEDLSNMRDHHSLPISSCLKISLLIRPNSIIVPNEGLITFLTNHDVKSIERKLSLII